MLNNTGFVVGADAVTVLILVVLNRAPKLLSRSFVA